MSIQGLLYAEIGKIKTKKRIQNNSLRLYWLLFLRLISLTGNLVKTRIYLKNCELLGKIAFTFGKPKIINEGSIQIGNLIRIASDINKVLIDVQYGGELSIGENVRLNGCNISVHSGVKIGNNCRIGTHCIIMDSDHHDISNRLIKAEPKPIVIEDDVWLATRTMVLKGVKIGKGAVIASGAVVTKDIPSYTLAAGVPAKVVKQIPIPEYSN